MDTVVLGMTQTLARVATELQEAAQTIVAANNLHLTLIVLDQTEDTIKVFIGGKSWGGRRIEEVYEIRYDPERSGIDFSVLGPPRNLLSESGSLVWHCQVKPETLEVARILLEVAHGIKFVR